MIKKKRGKMRKTWEKEKEKERIKKMIELAQNVRGKGIH